MPKFENRDEVIEYYNNEFDDSVNALIEMLQDPTYLERLRGESIQRIKENFDTYGVESWNHAPVRAIIQDELEELADATVYRTIHTANMT